VSCFDSRALKGFKKTYGIVFEKVIRQRSAARMLLLSGRSRLPENRVKSERHPGIDIQ
jgi:hypothetical protein